MGEKSMSDPYIDTVRSMSRDLYDRLVNALATGFWPDGRPLTEEQREHAMGAAIAWGELHLPPTERIGYIDKGHKEGGDCDTPQVITLQGGD